MKTTIAYTQTDPAAKHAAAMVDIVDYLGIIKVKELTALFRKDYPKITLDQFQVMMGFAGIEGYPAKAFYNHIYGL